MNPVDSKLLKEKLDAVISAAEEFGQQSEQLNAAKRSIHDLISANNELHDQFVHIAESTQDYMDTAKKLIDEGFTAQINEDIQRVNAVIEQCEAQVTDITAQYSSVISTFKEHEDRLHVQQEKVLQQTDKGFGETIEQLGEIKSLLSESQDKHEKSSELQQQMLNEAGEKLCSHDKAANKGIQQIIETLEANRVELMTIVNAASAEAVNEGTKRAAEHLSKECSSIQNIIENTVTTQREIVAELGETLKSRDENIRADYQHIVETLEANYESLKDKLDATAQTISDKSNAIGDKIDAIDQRICAYIQTEQERYDRAQKLDKQKMIALVAGYVIVLATIVIQFFI